MQSTDQVFVAAIDFWEPSQNALQMAARFAKQYGGKIVALHVMEKAAHYPDAMGVDQDTLEEDLQTAMDALVLPLRDRGIAVETEVRHGNVTRILSQVVHDLQASLLFVGIREGRILDDIFIGQHTLQLIKAADVPLVVVDGNPHADEINEVLIPMDRKFGITGTLQFLKGFAGPLAERARLLTGMLPSERQDAVEAEAQVAADQLLAAGLQAVEIELVADIDVHGAVMDLLRSAVGSYDLVLLEQHDHASTGELTIGSLIENVVTKGRMPVLCAPSPSKR